MGASSGLGRVTHEVLGPNGSVLCHLDGWEAIGEAPGGDMSSGGRMAAAISDAFPDVLVEGAVLRSRLEATNEVVASGDLLPLGRDGNVLLVAAVGPGTLAEDDVDTHAWQHRRYAEWAPGSSEPFLFAGSSAFQAAAEDGQLRFYVPDGVDVVTDNVIRLTLWLPNNEVRRVAFTISVNRSLPGFDLEIETRRGPSGVVGTNPRFGLNLGGPPSGPIDVPDVTAWDVTPADGDDLINLTLRRTAGNTTMAQEAEVILTDLRVDYLAAGDDYSVSAIVRDACALLGIRDALVDPLAQIGVPIVGTLAEVLSQCGLLGDARHLFYDGGGGVAVCDFGPWSRRRWSPAGNRQRINPVQLLQYDAVRVNYLYPNTQVQGTVTGVATRLRLRHSRTFPIDLPTPCQDAETATALGSLYADYLVQPRYGGDATLSEVVDETGWRCSAHRVRAGDEMYLPSVGAWARIQRVRHTDSRVELTFDDGLAVLNRLIAQRERSLMLV